MAQGNLYKKPILFALVATVTVLAGTIATMVLPMFTPGMHPKLDTLKPYTALELAGRDVYQREGCNNCHTQTVRPLMFEIKRYVDTTTYAPTESYSLAGEQAYERPFLWGSKRTGPDLARVGLKYGDADSMAAMVEDPQMFGPVNMPSYAFLREGKIDPASIKAHMDALGFPYTDAEIAELETKNELDAMAAYLLTLGRAIKKEGAQ